jgi:hypothetical protein
MRSRDVDVVVADVEIVATPVKQTDDVRCDDA